MRARLYDVVVAHRRHVDPAMTFRHRLHTWLVDLDALPRLPLPLRPLARFDSRDHLGDPARSIRENLDRWLALRGVDLRGGQVLMLANARVLGHAFNPLTVYWCHGPGGDLECVVAEVHNTYGERHCYLLHPDADGIGETAKEFYVSPFLPERGEYRMRLDPPGERVALRIEFGQDGQRMLTATLSGHRLPATRRRILGLALRRPLVPQRVSALIRAHGLALWVRGAPRTPRHPHHHQEGVR
ncbi:DUF1365 domain-containing protein [Saccharopolyspora cebuensis]|uniref:DUF1365 domain-containing protein n=1 Tax=Saccharopolyspora cebuensis TaxID=418759 RepID=A0ABV4CGL4_9PSEU